MDLDALAEEAARVDEPGGAVGNEVAVGGWKKVRVPAVFLEAARRRTGHDGFGVQGFHGAPATWALLTAVVRGEDRDDEDLARRVRDLEARLEEAQRELQELQSESVAAVLNRGGDELFATHFGLSKAEFDFIFAKAEPDLLEMRRVFSQRPALGKTRERALTIDLPDVLGIVCRHVLLGQPFARICKGFPREDKHAEKGKIKSEKWARKIFDAARSVLGANDSHFSRAFLRRQTPAEVWAYTRDNHPEIVEFLQEYVKDYNAEKAHYVVLVDGTHLVAKTVSDFYAMGLTYSRKKAQNTLLSICGSVATGMFAFYTEPVGGKTSEKAVCDGTDMYAKMANFAEAHDAVPVFIVDKGFGFFVKYAAAGRRGSHSVFIPHGARGGKQLSVAMATFNRDQARIRMPIEHYFGCLKRRCGCLKWGALQLGAHGVSLSVTHAVRLSEIVRLSFGFFNGFRMAGDRLIVFKKQTRYEVRHLVLGSLCV